MIHLDRPTDFKRFYGNKVVKDSIMKNVLGVGEKERPHSFLFTGLMGCGKTTLARLLAGKLGVLSEDVIEINAANMRSIDTAREIIERSRYFTLGRKKCFIFDEAHQLMRPAQEALLKLTEEPPEHVYIMFCSTEPEKILKTLRDRCVAYNLSPLSEEDTKSLYKYIVDKYKIEIPTKVVKMLLEASAGRPRRLLMNIEKCNGVSSAKQAQDLLSVADDSVDTEIIDICRALLKKEKWDVIAKRLQSLPDNVSAETIRRVCWQYFISVLQNAKDAYRLAFCINVLECFDTPIYEEGKYGRSIVLFNMGKVYLGMLSD